MIAQTLYLSGPVTGMPDRNEKSFHQAQFMLEKMGYDVINPLQVVADPETGHDEAMKLCLSSMADADGVCLLEGWESSAGAMQEYAEARRRRIEAKGLFDWIADRKAIASKGW